MHELYKLKEMLCDELKEYGAKNEMSAGALEIVDKLAHAIKNIDKIIEEYEDEYSGNYPDGGSYRYDNRMARDGGSYARGRGRNAKRDSMGRYSSERGYSRDGHALAEELREMMRDIPDERTRQKLQRFVSKVEDMD